MSPTRHPEVSIIINCFNEAQCLRETLDSVFAQTHKDWEVVFWDNASTDNSSDIAAEYGQKVLCFKNDTQLPLGQVRKMAYDQTQGDYIAILDADDVWLPEKLEKQIALFKADPDVGMTYSNTMCFDAQGDQYQTFKMTNPVRGMGFGPLITRNFITSSSMMFSRNAIQQLGYAFDDSFARAQDYDLSLRMAYSFPMDYVEDPVTKWRINGLAEKPWKRKLIPRSEEVRISMDRLIEAHPQIKNQFQEELVLFNRELDYNFAIDAWRDGRPREARRFLSRHWKIRKFGIVYCCSFLMTCDFFYSLRTKLRRRST